MEEVRSLYALVAAGAAPGQPDAGGLATSYVACFAVGTTLAMLVLLKVVQRFLYPKPIAHDLAEGNSARRLKRVGQVVAVFLVSASAVKSGVKGEDVLHDIAWVLAFGSVAVILVSLTGRLGVQLLLQSRLPKEIDRGNVAAGVAAAANYVATGIITARAIAGNSLHDLGLALVFFVLAQITLHLFATLFRALTTYDDAEQIAGENLAAALSYGGLLIGVAIVVARAVEGDFTGWPSALKGYGLVLLSLLAFYPVRQLFVQMLLLHAPFSLRGGKLDAAISADRNVGMGALEAATYVATALAIVELA
jgi:uncharacterized membrane protein YjfL (UPF0719 family)